MSEDLNIKLREETGEETRDALNKYKNAYDLNSQEKVIRHILPEWAFNPIIPPTLGRVKDMTNKSRHYDFDLSKINESDLYEFNDLAEKNGDVELVSEIEEILFSRSSFK